MNNFERRTFDLLTRHWLDVALCRKRRHLGGNIPPFREDGAFRKFPMESIDTGPKYVTWACDVRNLASRRTNPPPNQKTSWCWSIEALGHRKMTGR
jgi:hypothetical protein